MRITPLAVWCYKLSKEDLFHAVKLQTALTHSNPLAIEASYLYCFAIQKLIMHGNRQKAFHDTLEESKRGEVKLEDSLTYLLEKVVQAKDYKQA
jgi:ADP-ribosylglycohydrolase